MIAIKEWALRWVEGIIVGYLRGSIELKRAVGMINRALESYGVTIDELSAIILSIEQSPVHLPYMNSEEKKARLKPLKEKLFKTFIKEC